MTTLNRRLFLTSLAAGAGLIALPPPVRRYWQVPGNAPVVYRAYQIDEPRIRVITAGSTISHAGQDHDLVEIYAVSDLPRILSVGTAYRIAVPMTVDWTKHFVGHYE